MITCETLEEAQTVEGLIHIESGADGIVAYQQGDTLPENCVPPPPVPEQSDIEILQAKVAELQEQLAALIGK